MRSKVPAPPERLTPGEHEVLRLLIDGESNKTIAAELEVSVRTIEVRRAKLMKKMKADSLAELIRVTLSANPHYGRPPSSLGPPRKARRRVQGSGRGLVHFRREGVFSGSTVGRKHGPVPLRTPEP